MEELGGMGMKVIFLDVDGVLNYVNCKIIAPSGFYFVDDNCIIRLKEIIERTKANIILSSTWRQGYYDLQEGSTTSAVKDYQALQDKLREFDINIYGHTPILKEMHRGSEILSWLQTAKDEVEAMVILDDGNDLYPLEKYHVKTSFKTGLRTKNVMEAIRMLNGA